MRRKNRSHETFAKQLIDHKLTMKKGQDQRNDDGGKNAYAFQGNLSSGFSALGHVAGAADTSQGNLGHVLGIPQEG